MSTLSEPPRRFYDALLWRVVSREIILLFVWLLECVAIVWMILDASLSPDGSDPSAGAVIVICGTVIASTMLNGARSRWLAWRAWVGDSRVHDEARKSMDRRLMAAALVAGRHRRAARVGRATKARMRSGIR